MRAAEITEYSITDKKIDKILAKKGYKKLGAGVDQTAYLEPGTGYVLKVFGTQGGESFSADHRMFFAWAKYCMKNSNNPFLPRFGGYDSFMLDGDRYLQIRQEPLTKASPSIGGPLEAVADAIEENPPYSWAKFEEYEDDLADDLIEVLGNPQAAKQFYNTMMALFRISEKQGWVWDLHAGNFMMRGRTPVIVDPWVIGHG